MSSCPENDEKPAVCTEVANNPCFQAGLEAGRATFYIKVGKLGGFESSLEFRTLSGRGG